jgi:hypothetical protein
MSNYDQIAASILHNNPAPHAYIVDIVEKDDEPGLMYLRIYADDILGKPEHKAEDLANWLNSMLSQLNQWTTASWTYEMAEKPQ